MLAWSPPMALGRVAERTDYGVSAPAFQTLKLQRIPMIREPDALIRPLCEQARLLPRCTLLRLDRGNGGHVEHAAGRHRGSEDVGGAGRTDQDRTDGHGV